jgi:hypothetical protein
LHVFDHSTVSDPTLSLEDLKLKESLPQEDILKAEKDVTRAILINELDQSVEFKLVQNIHDFRLMVLIICETL